MKHLIAFAVAFTVFACAGNINPPTMPPTPPLAPEPEPEPEPEPPPTSDCDFKALKAECAAKGVRVKRKQCRCEEPEPPPSSGADPADYIAIDRVPSLMFWQSHKWQGLFRYDQSIYHGGFQDYNKVLQNCGGWGPRLLGSSDSKFRELATRGQGISEELRGFMGKLWKLDEPDNSRNEDGTAKPNRRCDRDDKNFDPAFLNSSGECAKSNVRKDAWNDFKDRMLAHDMESNGIRGIAGECRDDSMKSFDSIAGWCNQMNAAGYRSCP